MTMPSDSYGQYTPGPCWLGSPGSKGYVRTRYGTEFGVKPGSRGTAHRYAYQVFYGELPKDIHLDHLCRRKNCYNPAHLQPVSPAENARRGKSNVHKPTCRRGHVWTDASTRIQNGSRLCRICQAEKYQIRKSLYIKGKRVPEHTKTHCKRGHAFTHETTYISPSTGRRSCKVCWKLQPSPAQEHR